MNHHFKNYAFAFVASLIWGFAFIAQSNAAKLIGPFAFNTARSFLAVIFLFVLYRIDTRRRGKLKIKSKHDTKELLLGAFLCGTTLTIASNLQQYAMEGTEAGKAGFITALYIVIVPLLGLFLKRKVGLNIWISVLISCVGLYFLCIRNGISNINLYDLALLGCAVMFSLQILAIDFYSVKINGILLSMLMFLVQFLESSICALIFETIDFKALLDCLPSLLYVGILSSGVGYTLQILAQKDANPTVISLIMSLESTFSVIFGAIVLKEVLSFGEYIGCMLMLVAVIFAQIPLKRKNKLC